MKDFELDCHLNKLEGKEMDCNKVMDLITEYLICQSLEKDTLKLVQEHIANCRRCLNELDATISVITGKAFWLAKKAEIFLTCSECVGILPEYAELGEKEAQEKYLDVRQHLQSCLTCQKDYKILRSMAEEEKKGVYGSIPSGPNLGDLSKVEIEKTRQIWEEVRRGVLRLSTDLKILVSKGTAIFQEIPLLLRPYQVPIPIQGRVFRGKRLRGETAISGQVQEFKIPDTDKDRQIFLTIRVNSKGEADLIIKVIELKTTSPIIGVSVILYDKNNLLLENAITSQDNEGIVELSRLTPEKYLLKIEHLGTTWEIPVTFSSLINRQG